MAPDGDPQRTGMRVQATIFTGIATFLLLAGAVYAAGSSEDAGTTMLLLSSAMALMIGAYLAVQSRKRTDPAQGAAPAPDGPTEPASAEGAYLPHASVWPFAMGMGLVVMANGLVLGMWALVPGALLAGTSLWGYARQSRRRD
ncbi:MAG: cytochrome c oxidase subunit 4 [Actinobacteria bacterium]|nr:cytochrome c oxidase subunit 4 [Actinomycetota bacterium]